MQKKRFQFEVEEKDAIVAMASLFLQKEPHSAKFFSRQVCGGLCATRPVSTPKPSLPTQ